MSLIPSGLWLKFWLGPSPQGDVKFSFLLHIPIPLVQTNASTLDLRSTRAPLCPNTLINFYGPSFIQVTDFFHLCFKWDTHTHIYCKRFLNYSTYIECDKFFFFWVFKSNHLIQLSMHISIFLLFWVWHLLGRDYWEFLWYFSFK